MEHIEMNPIQTTLPSVEKLSQTAEVVRLSEGVKIETQSTETEKTENHEK